MRRSTILGTSLRGLSLLAATVVLFAAPPFEASEPYDPLAIAEGRAAATLDLTASDRERDREIPLRVYLPDDAVAAPVVLFSHGLGGSREASPYLGEHWSGRGYVAVFLQHPGSDSSVWRDVAPQDRMREMEAAAGVQNFLVRVADVPAVLDQLERWNGLEGHSLAGRLDLEGVGMSGHSFGAVTTQAVGGQSYRGERRFADPRITAAIAMSPSSPRRGNVERAFGGVTIPWLLMTGTEDHAAIGHADVESRLAVFPALPGGRKYELVLAGAEHSAFTSRALPGDRQERNPNHHRAILALSTAFWDSVLRDDPAARAWLEGTGPRSVLEPEDRWQSK